jgi:Kef-type K+ transport system membrane component KefB
VLGELLVGILAGNAALLGGPDLAALASSETFTVLAELGAVLLLFHVGLESTPREMMAVGGRAFAVAVLGVTAPMILGYGVGAPCARASPGCCTRSSAPCSPPPASASPRACCRTRTPAHAVRRIILGAAVIDDVLGWSCSR